MSGSDLALAAMILVAAALYSSVGHAGASGYLAAMALLGVAPETMKPTALTLNILVASIASVQFVRAGCFSWRLFWPFALTSIPAAYVGGAITLPGPLYRPAVGAILLFAAYRMLASSRRAATPDATTSPPPIWAALGAGALIGVLSGLTGTGGGIFLSPLLLLAGWARTREAAGVAAVFILVNSTAGLLGAIETIDRLPAHWWILALAAAGGGLLGSSLGARRMSTPWLRRLLAAVLVVAASKLIVA
jgi:uncharacterized membrane protein YfcA